MATNLSHTVEEVLQVISDLRGESSTDTSAERIRAVSDAHKDFARRRNWSFFKLKNQTITGDGSSEYEVGSATYPYKPKGLTEMFVADTGDDNMTPESGRVGIVSEAKFTNLYNRNTATKMCFVFYDASSDAWKVKINPAIETGETVTYDYYYEPATVTATTDTVLTPNIMILAKLALARIYHSEEEWNSELAEKQEVEQLIMEAAGDFEDTPHEGQLYSMESIYNQISDHGIGTY